MALDMTAAVKIKASVDGIGQIEGLRKGLGGVEGQANRTGGALGRLRGAAGTAFGALRAMAPAITIAGLGALAKSTLDTADNLSKMSMRTGVAVPELARFSKAADLSDVSLEKVGKSLALLSRNMVNAKDGTASALEPFTQLGIKLTDANGKLRGSGDVLLEVARKFAEMEDGPRKAALAMELFGKSGVDLIPMLNMGEKEIRKLSTTMTQEFADKAATFNDRLTTLQANFGELATKLTMSLLPALEAIVGVVENVANAFLSLPESVQAIIGVLATLAISAGVLAPIFSGLAGIFGAIGPAIAAIVPMLAGMASALASVVPILITVGKVLIGVFTGPAGWVALAVAAGVAIYAFRDQIAAAFKAIGDILINAGKAFYNTFIDPVIKWNKFLFDSMVNIFKRLGDAIRAPFQAVANVVRGIINGMLSGIANAMNAVVTAINRLIQGANAALARLRLPQIPYLPTVGVPRFAEGGVVAGPTLAMVGEGGEPEYIVPQSKAAGFAANWLAGRRGAAAIPRFAEGGVVNPATSINIQTGPVLQQDGQRYVTINDLEGAMQTVVNTLLTNNRTTGGRRYAGVG